MKEFCYHCGAPVESRYKKRRFCSHKCGNDYHRNFTVKKPKERTIPNYFNLFKNIVAASADCAEFQKYWKKYFVAERENYDKSRTDKRSGETP